MRLLYLSCTTGLAGWLGGLAVMLVLLYLAAPFSSKPGQAAAGPGDGSTSSSWMSDKRMLKALSAIGSTNYPAAIEILTDLVADKPRFADAWNYLGFALRKSGALERAEAAYDTALRLNPKHRGAHEYLAELYLKTGRRGQAEKLERSLRRICRHGCMELDELRAALKSS